jgi:hypothetical protein
MLASEEQLFTCLHVRQNKRLVDIIRTVFMRFLGISRVSAISDNANISVLYCTCPAHTQINLGSLILFYSDNSN